jgi:hypothetical protein
MGRRVSPHHHGAPGKSDQADAPDLAALPDEIDGRVDVADGLGERGNGRIAIRRLGHRGGACRPAVAADIDQVDVVAGASDEVHPRQAVQGEVEGRLRREGDAVDEQHDAVGRKRLDSRRPLVADEELDAGGFRWHAELLHR